MQAKRFIAADMRRALDMVKNEFGEDAMILSTERTAKGVELVATVEAPASEIETCAFFMAIESLMPSPTKQMVWPSACSCSIKLALSSGNVSAK